FFGAGFDEKVVQRRRKLLSRTVRQPVAQVQQRRADLLRGRGNLYKLFAVVVGKLLNQSARMVPEAFGRNPQPVVDLPQKTVVFQLGDLRFFQTEQRIFAQRKDVLGVKVGAQAIQCREYQRKDRDRLDVLALIQKIRNVVLWKDVLDGGEVGVDVAGNDRNLVVA